jgi:hypothetical protein
MTEEELPLKPLLGGYFKKAQKRAVRDVIITDRVRFGRP